MNKMEVDGTVDSDVSFNNHSEVYLTYDLQVLVWYFKNGSAYSDRFAEMQFKLGTFGLNSGIFS